MRKMTIIAGILSLCVAGILFYAGIQANKNITTFERRVVADGKYFGEPVYLREMITPDDIAIQQFVKKHHLDEGTPEQRVIKTYNLFERPDVYFYTDDKSIIFKNDSIELSNFDDVWEKPKLILAEYDNKGRIAVDCETGSSLLTSLFIAEGVEAKEVIGEVNIPGQGIYGHGWTIVKLNGKWYLIESTEGKPLQKFIPVPPAYKAYFIFDDKTIQALPGANIQHIPPMLNQDGVKKLRQYLSQF